VSAQSEERAPAWGIAAASEPRWPASLAMLAAAGLNFILPGKFTLGPPWLVPLLELAILIPLYVSSPNRRADENRLQGIAANVLIAIANVANIVSLALLVRQIVFNAKATSGTELLYSSLAIWVTNILVFALWYWELDRGGPDARLRHDHPAPDFLFPQMITPDCTHPTWTPSFIDYLYLAFTDATAFSPADVMPLSAWAKMMMLAESLVSLATITIVASRAVGIIS
jgi:uncharacterized membrane protein